MIKRIAIFVCVLFGLGVAVKADRWKFDAAQSHKGKAIVEGYKLRTIVIDVNEDVTVTIQRGYFEEDRLGEETSFVEVGPSETLPVSDPVLTRIRRVIYRAISDAKGSAWAGNFKDQ